MFIYAVSTIVFIFLPQTLNAKLPPYKAYRMDDYTKCRQNNSNNNDYCLFTFRLPGPFDKNNSLGMWEYDPGIVERMYCVPKTSSHPIEYGLKRFRDEVNLTGVIEEYECEHNWEFPYVKYFSRILIVLYVIFLFYANTSQNKGSNWLDAFNLSKNYAKLFQDNPNPDYQKLKAIHGIRVILTVLMVLGHSVITVAQVYKTDISQIEMVFENGLVRLVLQLSLVSLQFFFLISGFLLTYYLCVLEQKQGRPISLKQAFNMLFNRFMRLWPPLLIAILGVKSGLLDGNPHTIAARNMIIPACDKKWWYTMLQITYFLPFRDICTPGYWYTSVDTLFYILIILIIYVCSNYKIDLIKITPQLIGIAMLISSCYLFITDYNFWAKSFPDVTRALYKSQDLTIGHTSPFTNLSTSLVGMWFGLIYFKYKTKPFKISKYIWMSVVGLPIVALYLGRYQYGHLISAVMPSIIKPLYAVPLGVGMLAIAFGGGGVFKQFLESKCMMVLSNVTYCVYIFHFAIVLLKLMMTKELFVFQASHLFYWAIFDLIVSFIFAAVLTLVFEYPGLALQKMYAPQLKTSKKIKE